MPPPLVALAALAAQRLLPRSRHSRIGNRLLGAGLIGVGVATAVVAAGGFRRAETTLDPLRPEETSVLVTTGMHAWSRNPMYLGLVGVLVGHAAWRRSQWALLPAAAAWLWLDRVQVAAEERAMQERYGEVYRDYRERVPRWLGLVGRNS